MVAQIIDGKKKAEKMEVLLSKKVFLLQKKYKITPCVAVILIGNDIASQIYVRNKIKVCKQYGIKSLEYFLSAKTSDQNLVQLIHKLNKDKKVHGILVQLPLPSQINAAKVLQEIDPQKDVDGFHVINIGKRAYPDLQKDSISPCTPKACLLILKEIVKTKLSGKKVIVIGRSNIVGKPLAQLLLNEDCTVKIAHSKTKNLKDECLWADIIISCTGKPKLIKANMVSKGTVVIDVGISRYRGKLIGDVDFENVKKVASYITPVPRGVGPMTVACLLENVYEACLKQNKII